ncbi:type VI secretion protein, family [Marinibacterium anthonyi]|nr:type VI secretion protein, family [Marinibacterium anthonyi]
MSDSQKFIARNRAPRVQIEYDVELYGSEKTVQLPFVMGVMSDLAGKSHVEQPAPGDRKFLEIDVDNFDDRMKAMAPRVAFAVPNTLTGEGNLEVDLTFEKMSDFDPGAIAAKIGPLKALLEARTQLSNLMAYMDGKAGAERLIETILSDPSLLAALGAAAPAGSAEADAALDRLRALAPTEPAEAAEHAEEDRSDAILSSLAAAAPEEGPEADATSDVLSGLAAAAPVEEERDGTGDILSALTTGASEERPSEDTTSRVLSGLAGQAPVAEDVEEEQDTFKDILSGLAATAPEDEAVRDTTTDVLSGLSARAPVEEETDTFEDILSGLATSAHEEASTEDTTTDVLSGLSARAPVEEETDTFDDILSGLATSAPQDAPEDATAEILSDMTARAGEPAPGADQASAILGDLSVSPAPAPEPDARTEDILAELGTGQTRLPPRDTDTDDGLDDLLADLDPTPPAETGDDGLDDILGDLGVAALDDARMIEPIEDAPVAKDDPAPVAQTDDLGLDDLLGGADTAEPAGIGVADDDGLDDLLGDLGALMGDEADEAATREDATAVGEVDDDGLDDLLGDLAVAGGEDGKVPDVLAEPPGDGGQGAAPGPEVDPLDDLLNSLTDLTMDGADAEEDAASPDVGLLDDLPSAVEAPPQSEPDLVFGSMTADRPDPQRLNRKRFRIALFGDFSGRAARGALETGDALAARAPVMLDPDSVEEIIARFAGDLVLPVGRDGAGVKVPVSGLDDLHPDEIYEKVELFAELNGLRGQLKAGATSAGALARLKQWAEAHDVPLAPTHRRSAATSVPADRKLSDFQRLIGDHGATLTQTSPVEDMIARIIGPHVRRAPDMDAVKLVDEAISSAMRLILHHPDFQALESQWRSLDLLARSIEADDKLDVMLYDVSAEEIAADLAAAEDLAQSGIVRLLTGPPLDEETGRGGYSALIGLYTFEETPPHAQILGRIARVAAHVDAPFVAAMSPGFLEVKKEDRHPLVAEAWDTLRAMPEAAYIGLATPRFMLRRPYGAKSEPIYEFDFEEFTMAEGLKGLLWANPVVLVTILMAQSFRRNGPALDLGSVMSLGDVPFHFITDRYGDQVALPCTERNLTLSRVEDVMARGFMPVVSIKGRDEIRLGSFNALGGAPIRGAWSDLPPPETSPPRPPAPKKETPSVTETTDIMAELDDILSGFSDDAAPAQPALSASGGDGDIDADLAALLEDL